MPAIEKHVKIFEIYNMLDLLKPMEPPMKRRAGLRIVQAGRGSYRGMFWKLKHQEETVLEWEDGFFCDILNQKDVLGSTIPNLYFDDSNNIESCNLRPSLCNGTPSDLVELSVPEMSKASHVIGKGVVGEAALTGNARWIQSDSIASDVPSSILVSQYTDEWLLQFATGIKTILLLPVLPDGILQLGSVEMVAENAAFVAYVKSKYDACKETGELDSTYVAEQFTLRPTFMNNLEETSSSTADQVIYNQNSIHAVKLKDRIFNTHQMVPVYMFEDVCNTSVSPTTDSPENVAESESSRQPMDSIHLEEPSVNNETCNEENFRASSNCKEFDDIMYGGFMNELPGFREGVTESTCRGNDYELQSNKAFDTSDPHQDVLSHSISDREPFNTMYFPTGFPSLVANARRNFDNSSSEKSNITSVTASGKSFAFSKACGLGLDTKSKFPASVSSVESKINSSSDKQNNRKRHDSLKRGRLSTTNKKRVHTGDIRKPRPRDRQMIKDRIKELRVLVPNSDKCSIDDLLDKTIKHMLFLKGVTNQVDKLTHPITKEEDDIKTTKSAEVNSSNRNGTSWAVEIGSEQQLCPIIVKDLDLPGHMLIEMLCTDHDRFLEITDVIHRLQLTIIKGVMEESADNPWARFIVETSGKFHRLDIFWPLMQLLQRSRAPIST